MTDPSECRGIRDPTRRTEESVRVHHDWTEVSPSLAVVEAVADATARDPATLAPLYEYVDPDALNALVRSPGTGPSEQETTLSFVFDRHRVTVTGGGDIFVEPYAADE